MRPVLAPDCTHTPFLSSRLQLHTYIRPQNDSRNDKVQGLTEGDHGDRQQNTQGENVHRQLNGGIVRVPSKQQAEVIDRHEYDPTGVQEKGQAKQQVLLGKTVHSLSRITIVVTLVVLRHQQRQERCERQCQSDKGEQEQTKTVEEGVADLQQDGVKEEVGRAGRNNRSIAVVR